MPSDALSVRRGAARVALRPQLSLVLSLDQQSVKEGDVLAVYVRSSDAAYLGREWLARPSARADQRLLFPSRGTMGRLS